MVAASILFRTFFIKAEQYGSAFTLDVDGIEYLVTARHLLDTEKDNLTIRIFNNKKWHDLPATVVGHGRGEIDISVLKLPERLTPIQYRVIPTIASLSLGQDVYFLGFPYKMWSDVGNQMNGLPMPFVKKGTLSTLGDNGDYPEMFYVDAINNEGFSGGPLFFYPNNGARFVHVAGVVSKYRIEFEPVVDAEGVTTGMSIAYNTGFMVVYSTKHVLEIIAASRRG